MRTTMERSVEKKLLITLNDLAGMLSCGLQTARKVADDAGARIEIGSRVLYSVEKIEKHLKDIGA